MALHSLIWVDMKNFKYIDLFAGIGGLMLPFHLKGAKCLLTSEINKASIQTYKENFKHDNSHIYVGDISKVKIQDIPSHDILLAGFPCQSYSIAGLRKGLQDPRGELFLDILKILKHNQPKAFMLENVKNMVHHDSGKTFSFIISELENQGYNVYTKIMNTMKYGNIPQNRERVYIVGFHRSISSSCFNFPSEIPLTNTIKDMLETKKVDDKYYYTNRYACYGLIEKEIIKEHTVYQWRRKYVRENKNAVCPTLTANMGTGGHNVPLIKDSWGIRKLTPRECARFQGFPDSYKLPNLSDSHLYQQFGNSVTVTVIERIADEILKVLLK